MSDPRRIYYDHEPAYRKIAASGGRGWDDNSPGRNPDSYAGIAAYLATVEPERGERALDLGCGGGQATILLARRGFDALGIDFAETAIELARRNAREAGVSATFARGDCLSLEGVPAASFDLALDNHVLHCVVEPRDRSAFLASTRRVLKLGGRLFSDTMSGEEGFDPVRMRADPRTRIATNGTRIFVTRVELNGELEAAGFRVVRQDVRSDPDPGNPADIVTVALAV